MTVRHAILARYGRVTAETAVYDRWGNQVFDSESIEARWDGTSRGKPLNPGVFAWVARISGYRKDGTFFATTESGSVTLVIDLMTSTSAR